MMSENRSPIIDRGDGTFESLLPLVRFAYHLDNRRFVRYLQEEAKKEGVHHIDAEVTDAALTSNGDEIAHLITDDGRRLEFDLYVDCSGFRSMLIEKKLRSPYISYASSLFTDRAIAANAPHGGLIKPYTTAESMDNGWCWNIPFEEADHLGYVHASAFCSEDQAVEEMRRKHPGITDPWVVKFRSGRHEHFWKGNVVAVGNSYAFVEPLESTAIHMIVFELVHLTNHFPGSRRDQPVKELLNKKINALWDGLRWFLSIHYKFNRKFSTPFWNEIQSSCDVSGAEERVQLFRQRAPLSGKPSLFYYVYPPDFFSDDHAFDIILLGQQIDARYLTPTEDREGWARKTDARRRLVKHALPMAKSLELIRERPEMLAEFVSSPKSWVHRWLTG
jgi:tryptophan 7-halogenase